MKQLKRAFARELATVGSLSGAAAAVPVAGTAVAVSTALAEFGWFTLRSGDLILAVAAVHGHTESSVEERRAWVLSVLVYGNSAATMLNKLAGESAKGLGAKATSRISAETLRSVNRTIGRTIVTKYGTKRGAIAIGNALPLGIGAVIGGSANYALARAVGSQADRFFSHLSPSPAPDCP